MEKREKNLCNLLINSQTKFGRKRVVFTIKEIIKMVKEGTIVLSPIQRNFVTKKTNGIIMSVVTGRGIDDIWVNYKGGKYYVFDGRQRLTSLLLYFLGITSKNFQTIIGDEWGEFINKREVVLDVNSIEDCETCAYDKELISVLKNELGKKKFSELGTEVKEMLLTRDIGFVVYDNLSLDEEISLYIDKNKGTTALNATELLKAQAKCYLWGKIEKYANSLGFETRGKERLSAEKLAIELFAIYLNSINPNKYALNGSWVKVSLDVIEEIGKLDNEGINAVFTSFTKSFNSFIDNGLMCCAKQQKDRKGIKFDAFDLKVVYKFYLENYKNFLTVTGTWSRIADCFISFVNNQNSYQGINNKYNNSYKHFLEQGTSSVSNIIKAKEIFMQSGEFSKLFSYKLCLINEENEEEKVVAN